MSKDRERKERRLWVPFACLIVVMLLLGGLFYFFPPEDEKAIEDKDACPQQVVYVYENSTSPPVTVYVNNTIWNNNTVYVPVETVRVIHHYVPLYRNTTVWSNSTYWNNSTVENTYWHNNTVIENHWNNQTTYINNTVPTPPKPKPPCGC